MAQGQASSQNPGSSQGSARVRFGLYDQVIPAGKATIANMRDSYTSMYKMPKDTLARINGNVVDDNYVLQPGDEVEFYRNSGEKG